MLDYSHETHGWQAYSATRQSIVNTGTRTTTALLSTADVVEPMSGIEAHMPDIFIHNDTDSLERGLPGMSLQRYVIAPGDTYDSIALKVYQDPSLSSTIAAHHGQGPLVPGQIIELPQFAAQHDKAGVYPSYERFMNIMMKHLTPHIRAPHHHHSWWRIIAIAVVAAIIIAPHLAPWILQVGFSIAIADASVMLVLSTEAVIAAVSAALIVAGEEEVLVAFGVQEKIYIEDMISAAQSAGMFFLSGGNVAKLGDAVLRATLVDTTRQLAEMATGVRKHFDFRELIVSDLTAAVSFETSAAFGPRIANALQPTEHALISHAIEHTPIRPGELLLETAVSMVQYEAESYISKQQRYQQLQRRQSAQDAAMLGETSARPLGATSAHQDMLEDYHRVLSSNKPSFKPAHEEVAYSDWLDEAVPEHETLHEAMHAETTMASVNQAQSMVHHDSAVPVMMAELFGQQAALSVAYHPSLDWQSRALGTFIERLQPTRPFLRTPSLLTWIHYFNKVHILKNNDRKA